MERNWTNTGKKETAGIEHRYAAMFERLEWVEIPKDGKPLRVAAMPGLNIKEAIKELRLPKVSHIAISHEAAPYGLYGIRCYYTNGMAEVFLLDRGSDILPLFSDFHEGVKAPEGVHGVNTRDMSISSTLLGASA